MIISNIEDNHIQSLKLTDDIINNKQVVGSFLKNTGELSILNLNHTYDNLEHTYIDIKGFGKWYVDELKSDEEYISSTLKLNDITQKFDEDYQDTFSFPATMKEWATWIGLQVGIPLKGDFLNSDIVLSERPYIGDNPSWRNAVQIIAKYSGGYAQKNYDNTYSIKWFDNTVYDIEDWENFVHGNQKPPINVLILSTGDTEDNVKYPEETPSEPHELRIEDDWNYIDRYSINKNIYNQVFGFAYTPITKLNVPYGLLELRAGQKISTKDIEGNDIETYISKHTLEWQGGDYEDVNSWSSSIEIPELKDTSTNYSYANSVLNKVLRVERTTDKNTGDIRDLIQETTNNTEKVTSFEMTLEKIEQEVSYFDDQSQAIAKLTTSIEGIEAQIGSITDTTVSANGIGNITLKNVLTSELLYLQIYPTKEDLSYLNISPKTYLSNNTKLTSRDLLFLKDPKNVFNGKLENGSIDKDGQNGTSPELDTTTYIELKEKLYSINDVADEHDLISGKGIKRIGECVLTGDESIIFEKDGYIRARIKIDNSSKEGLRKPIISNYFKYALTVNDEGTGFMASGCFYFYLPKEYTTKAQYKQWLKDRYNEGNPVIFKWILETPEEITTEPVNIQLRKGYNRIEIKDKNGLLNKTKLSYLADTEKTVEGTNSIIIDDAEPVNARSLIVYGNSFQETGSGKNKFDINDVAEVYPNSSHLDYKIEGNKVTLTAIGASGAQYIVYYISDLDDKERYIVSYKTKKVVKGTDGSPNNKLLVYGSNDNISFVNIKTSIVTSPVENEEYKLDVSFTGYKYYKLSLYNNGDRTVTIGETTEYYDIQFEPGNEATVYEPYLKKPSPEFPSEIKCVEGLGNIFDGELEYGSLNNATGETSDTNNCIRSKNFNSVESNKEYTILNDKNYSQYIYEYNENKEFIKFINNTKNPFIFTTGNTTKYIKFRTVATNTENDLNAKFMLSTEKDIDFTFYDKKFLKLIDIGENLYNYKDTATVTSGITTDDDGWITINGNNSSGSSAKYMNYYTHNLDLTEGTDYNIIVEIKEISGDGHIRFIGTSGSGGQFKNPVSYDFSNINEKVIQNIYQTKDSFENILDIGLRTFASFQAGEIGSITFRISVLEDTSITPENFVYEPYVPNKVRNTEKFAIGKSTYTIDLTGATDTYLFFYDENDNFIGKSGYHKLPYTFNNADAKYIRFMFKNVNNDNLNVNDIKNLTIYDVNANEPAIRYTLPCNLYYINDEIKDELIIDYEKEQTFVIKRVGINAETGEKYALETARTDFYKYVGIDFKEDGNYLLKMESFTTAYINARALANSIYTAQYPTRVEVNNAIKLSEEGIRQEVNGKVTDLNGNVKELKGSLELKLNTKDLCTELNGSADKIAFIGDRFSWKSTYSSMTDTGTLKATNVDLTGKITATSGTIGGCSISSGVLKVADANITSINASKITAGTMSADRISGGTIDATKTTVKNLNATNITSGTIDASKITVKNLNASNITSGTISTSRLESKVITTSNLSAQKISASQITTGTLSADRISGGTISGNNVSITNINASNITGGSMSMSRISGGTLNVGASGYYLRVGVGYTHPTVSGLNVNGGGGINMYGNCGISNCYTVANGDDLYLASNSGTVHLGHGSSGSGHPVEVYNSMVYLNQAVDITTNSFYVRKVDGTRLTLSAYINEASSIKMKENILPINQDFIETLYQEVKNLKLYSFDYIKKYINDDIQRKNKYGFMIEDIKEKNIGKLLDIEENNDIALYSGKGLAKLDLILIKMLIEKIEKLESR